MPLSERKNMVKHDLKGLSVRKQCDLLMLHRSGLYYQPRGESELNLELMRLIDEHYLEFPFYGARRMHTWLTMDMGYEVSRNRIDRLYYKIMGLRCILPGPHTSKRNKEHKVFPYLLRELKIDRPNQVWAIDITYIPMPRGFMYLTAIIDLYSRYVVNWSVSNTMTTEWCVEVVKEAVEQYGPPEILNTDQGSQFTANDFADYVVEQAGVKLSMDGKGRATDNAFIERLWRSVKYEYVYISPPEDGITLYEGIRKYMHYYNTERRHQSINNDRPKEVYVGSKHAA